jgi:hypothetical protein
MILAAALLAATASCAQPKPAKEPIRIEFKVELRQEGNFHTFAFEGTTNLPPGTMLRATVYYPEEYERPGPEGKVLKEMIPDHLFLRDYENRLRVREGGKFSTELYRIRRRPFSLPYHGRVSFDPTETENNEVMPLIRKTLENQPVEKIFAFSLGDPKEFETECVESARSLDEDFKKIRELMELLKKTAAERKEKPDEAAWGKFKDDFYLKVRLIQDGNEDRFTMFKYFVERKGKFHVQDLTDLLLILAETFERDLKGPKDPKLDEELHGKLTDFEELYAMGWEELDLDRPDAAKLKKPVSELAKPVEAALEMVRLAVEGKPFDWEQARDVLQSTVTQAAFNLCDEKVQTTKKIHPFVSQVLGAFNDLAEAMEDFLKDKAVKQAVQERAETLKTALQALRDFAGQEK